MKKLNFLKSIYAKFAIIFLGIWWMLNILTFSVIAYMMARSPLPELFIDRREVFLEMRRLRGVTGLIFLASAVLGTIVILIVLRSVVRPIKKLSDASKEVARGNFDIKVENKNNDEIGRLISDFNLMVSELRNIDLLRKDFVSNVSHEFKTPITSIKGFAKLIRDGDLTEGQLQEYSSIIVNESDRLSMLSSNLLRLSELDSKMIREQAVRFSLDEQIRQAILILEPQWTRKNIELDIELDEISYLGDKNLLQQVWLNLLQNAVKFSYSSGIISVRLIKVSDIIKVSISDNGMGISDEEKNKIFERFYKVDKSRVSEGSGLGLAIVKKIVELSNGRIYVESEMGRGTTFTVELPDGREQ